MSVLCRRDSRRGHQCKHCGEFLEGAGRLPEAEEKQQWYFRTPFIVIALSCVGPLALPLIWWRPRTSMAWKIGLTIGISVLSVYLYQVTMDSIRTLQEYYKMMG